MSKLVDALKPGCRLILLGDKDQLASVESGAVLADLTLSMPANTVELLKSHRFQGGIKRLADAVNQQNSQNAWELLIADTLADAALLEEKPLGLIVNNTLKYLQLIADGVDYKEIFSAFNSFQVLCANQQGPNSVAAINTGVELELSRLHKIKRVAGPWYPGRPVMVTANSPSLQLFNGDIGICLKDPQTGQLQICFLRADGSLKKLPPARLQACETVFAMTIHKSQGSEFDRVLIMLPEQPNPVLSKELLYTAITRAKQQVFIVANPEVFKLCVGRRIERQSGLAARLTNTDGTIDPHR